MRLHDFLSLRLFSLLLLMTVVRLCHASLQSFANCLIGAMRTPVGVGNSPSGDARNELEGLVKLMAAHRANGCFHHVYRCPDLGQLVVTKVVGFLPPPSSVAIPPTELNSTPSLYASDGVQTDSKSPLLSLVNAIWNEVGLAIEQGHFSCRGKQFWAFNDDELRVIRAALA